MVRSRQTHGAHVFSDVLSPVTLPNRTMAAHIHNTSLMCLLPREVKEQILCRLDAVEIEACAQVTV